MNVLHHHPIESASDEELMERLYDVACQGRESEELARLDAIVYSRFAMAYGEQLAPVAAPCPLAA